MSASLESFPEETLERIVSFVQHPTDLASLLRVSKRFNRIGLPHLYADVSCDSTIAIGGKVSRQIYLLTFLMLQRPKLAALVKRFTLRQNDDEPEDQVPEMGWPERSEVNNTLRNAIQKHTQDEEMQKKWFMAVGIRDTFHTQCHVPALLALLLPALVNLRLMDVPFYRKWDWAYWDSDDESSSDTDYLMQMFIRAAYGRALVNGLPMFGNLTDIILSGNNDSHPEDPVRLTACIKLPAIKRIYVHNQGDKHQYMDNTATRFCAKLKPSSSSVDYMELRRCIFNVQNFKSLLQAPKCLKTLIYEFGNAFRLTFVKFSATQSALEYQKDNLERLLLGHDLSFFVFLHEHDMTPMSFSAFTSLKHLRLAPIFLYGQEVLQLRVYDATRESEPPSYEELQTTKMRLVEALPNQLETLGFIHCNDGSTIDRMALSLRELLENEQFQSLREVMIHSTNASMLEEKLEMLKKLPWKRVRLMVEVQTTINLSPTEYDDLSRPWGWNGEVRWGHCYNDIDGPRKIIYDSGA